MSKQARSSNSSSSKQMEGEGNYTAARRYDAAVRDFGRNNNVKRAAQDAQRAVEGPRAEELRAAERRGKAGPGKAARSKSAR